MYDVLHKTDHKSKREKGIIKPDKTNIIADIQSKDALSLDRNFPRYDTH